MSLARNINAVRFTGDGTRILATTTARRLAVIDIEHGEQLMSYDNCAFNGRDRTGLAVDPICPNMAVCCCVNGKGLTLFDLRMPLPLDFIYDLHQNIIRDVTFLNNSWPWVKGQNALMSVSTDGLCKVTTLDGRNLHSIDVKHSCSTVTPTPELYGSAADEGFSSVVMLGGDVVSAYVPDVGVKKPLRTHGETFIWKLRYTSNGSTLYTACDKGVVRRYRRYPDHHEYLGDVYTHRNDIEGYGHLPL
ncbi:PREDICTED: uncharacterized protein LOC106818447 [Priapulus caudatus]|uniref:Uncharacterized protein LOC106818447 n=1 Tax=Priapulus caudatus TaxID=37621 RepID=A0ABM1F2H2_PRICU|nr:PREDICTED: uncharacterized protein LOC106818447 [Priapulus caudatus]